MALSKYVLESEMIDDNLAVFILKDNHTLMKTFKVI